MKPIIFSTPMVQAILDGRKTQTRRIIKPQPVKDDTFKGPYWYEPTVVNKDGELGPGKPVFGISSTDGEWGIKSPYQPGDVLWVRETWCKNENPNSPNYGGYEYYADYEGAHCQSLIKWRSPRFMPKEAARTFLLVKEVRAEKVQDITEEDAIAEGMSKTLVDGVVFIFHVFWDSLNIKRGYGWDTNPWVWVVEFERMSKGEALLKESEVEEG